MNRKQGYLLFVIALAMAATDVQLHAQGADGIRWHLTPNPNSAMYPPYRDNMRAALTNNLSSYGSGDAAFRVLPSGTIISPAQATLRSFDASGFIPEAGFRYENQNQTFTLSQISWRFWSSDVSTDFTNGRLAASGNLSTNTFSITRIGTLYVNGKGGTDDVVYTFGSANLPVHKIEARGLGPFFDGSSPTAVAEIDAYVARHGSITLNAEIVIGGLARFTQSLIISSAALPPPTVSLGIAQAGSGFVLTYSSANAVSLIWTPNIGAPGLSGQASVFPTSTTTYTVVGVGQNGVHSAPASVTAFVPPPSPALELTVNLSPTGDVAPTTKVMLGVSVVNRSSQGTGPVQVYWQQSTGGGFVDWIPDGFSMNIASGQRADSSFSWNVGNPDGFTYVFRARARTSDGRDWFSNETPSLRIVGAVPSPVLAIAVVRIEGPGRFQLQRTTTPAISASWQNIPTAIFTVGEGAQQSVILPQGSAATHEFFRAVMVQ